MKSQPLLPPIVIASRLPRVQRREAKQSRFSPPLVIASCLPRVQRREAKQSRFSPPIVIASCLPRVQRREAKQSRFSPKQPSEFFSKLARAALLAAGCLLIFAAAGCQPGQGTAAKINVTQAYQTVSAHLTQDLATLALQTPQPSPTPPPTQPTATPQAALATATFEPPLTTPTPTVTLVCDRAAAGNPFDITIPDDTTLQPGTTFTKIWRLQNLGSCTWTTEYAARFFMARRWMLR